jgi:NTE family protein
LKKLKLLLFLILGASLITGCSQKTASIDIPATEPVPVEYGEIGVAVVLGGGGARGLAHVGVLEVFEENNIPIDMIVGCSAGSMIGALYADTMDAHTVREKTLHLKKTDLLDTSFLNALQSPWRLKAPIQGHLFQHFLVKNLSVRDFKDLKIPFVAVATDLISGEVLALRSGPIAPAVRASCALPPFFNPVRLYGRTLLDGGIINPVPVDIARSFNPKIVIAIDVATALPEGPPRNMFSLTNRCLHMCYLRLCDLSAKEADVFIRPELDGTGVFEDKRNLFLYNAGRQAALEALPAIKKKLEMHETKRIDIKPKI